MSQFSESRPPEERVELPTLGKVGQALRPPVLFDDHLGEDESPGEGVVDVTLVPAQRMAVAHECDPQGRPFARRLRLFFWHDSHLGSSYTATWLVLAAVKGPRRQLPHRSLRRSPANLAMRSNSAGHAYLNFTCICRTSLSRMMT
jgi:hypothetical protein